MITSSEILYNNKDFYRFTGPPENWLTAIKYMTWGLNRNNEDKWKKIQPGDIFILHSTGKSEFIDVKSCFLGFGVVGNNFRIKDDFLWLEEMEKRENIWPFLVPFSEIYLFSYLPNPITWDAPNLSNNKGIPELIQQLLKDAILFSEIQGFPAQGSTSGVRKDVSQSIITKGRELNLFTNYNQDSALATLKPSEFSEIRSSEEAFRYSETLQNIYGIKNRIAQSQPTSNFQRDNDLLDEANDAHNNVLEVLIEKFRSKGFSTFANRFVDLLAYDGKQTCLIEIKSTSNDNFRSQARKGLAQILEYDYFEVSRFYDEKKINPTVDRLKYLVTSAKPKDRKYVGFINKLDIGVGSVDSYRNFNNDGKDLGLSKLLL